MNADDQAEIVKLLHESRERSRGYADFSSGLPIEISKNGELSSHSQSP
jgi:hypothetical protein